MICLLQLEKVAGGIKATTDKGEEYEADAVMFAVGMMLTWHLILLIHTCTSRVNLPAVTAKTKFKSFST